MSRQEDRGSDSKRHRSRFDQQPSPKKSRRDGKLVMERPPSLTNLDSGSHQDPGQRHPRRLQDALPLETPRMLDSKVESIAGSKESDKKNNGRDEGAKRSSDAAEIPRSQSFFEHDDRGNDGQVGRSFSRRAGAERRWWKDSREEHRKRMNRTNDAEQKHENTKVHGKDDHAWRHDRYFEMEEDPKPPVRKSPAFRKQKIPADSWIAEKAATEPQELNHSEQAAENVKKEEREVHNSRHLGRPWRLQGGNREEAWRGQFSSADRYGGGNYRRRDRFGGRQGYQPGRGRVEKWKHDLYDEANRSPSPKNEEDQIAKVEALLAS